MTTVPPTRAWDHVATPRACVAIFAFVLLPVCGCGGGSGPSPPVVSIQPVVPPAIDGGQTAVLTATVRGDGSAMGVTWSVGCPGAGACGSMQSPMSANGVADYFQSVVSSSAQTVQITATSVEEPTERAVVSITVNPPPYALPVGPQTATVGVSFTLSLLPYLRSGTPFYTCVPESGSLPAGLGFDEATARIIGTPTTVTPPVTSTYNCYDSANPPVSTSPVVVSIQVLAPGAGASASPTRQARYGHTATLLPSGRVLLTGGTDPALTPVAELYDPQTGTFVATGPMTTARSEHTATVLADGEVLIVGGNGANGQPVASAEIFDPISGMFSATGHMAVARAQHAAALLEDGRVLITGGTDGSATLASAEIFDPATGQFSSTGSMHAARRWHTAATVATGQVLVSGGETNDAGVAVPLRSAELYEPDSGTFAATETREFTRAQDIARVWDGSLMPAPVSGIKRQERAGQR